MPEEETREKKDKYSNYLKISFFIHRSSLIIKDCINLFLSINYMKTVRTNQFQLNYPYQNDSSKR